jgi:peroxiredoxin
MDQRVGNHYTRPDAMRPTAISEPLMPSTQPPQTPAEAFRIARDSDAPINQRLETYAATLRALNPAAGGITDRMVDRLKKAGAGLNAPQVEDPMPPFLLPDDSAHLVSLEELLRNGPVAVALHRGHWCPYCRINAHGLAHIESEARAAGGQIVAITPERQEFAQRHKQDAGASFRMLTDYANGYALSLNLAIWIGDEMIDYLRKGGRNLESFHGVDGWFLPIPATFVVGTDGLITARFVDPDYRKRMDLDELVFALRNAR